MKAATKYDSCWKGMPEERKTDQAWMILHRWAHSSTPFRPATLVDWVRRIPAGADYTHDDARADIISARDWKWIRAVDEAETLFVGAKPKPKK